MTEKSTDDNLPLVREAFRGDAVSFQRLVEQYQVAVYNLCLRYVGNADAEDVAQETFIRAFLHKEQFSLDRAVLPWLLTVARHLCIDRIRKRKHMESIDSPAVVAVSDDPGPDAALSEKQQLALLEELMKSLPEGRREAIMLVDVEELSYQETADVLQVPVGTIMTWLHRGRARLKELLTKKQIQSQRCFSMKGAKA